MILKPADWFFCLRVGSRSSGLSQIVEDYRLCVDGLKEQLEEEPEQWEGWLQHFAESQAAVKRFAGGATTVLDCSNLVWSEVLSTMLLSEVIPSVSIRIINNVKTVMIGLV